MALDINDTSGRMSSDRCDTTATRRPDGSWTVTGRAGVYDRNQAITAMTVAEALADGYSPDHLLVMALEAELRDVDTAAPPKPNPTVWVGPILCCGVPDPDSYGGICGMPIESEPCNIHGTDVSPLANGETDA